MLNFVKGAEFGACENSPFGKAYEIRILANSSSLVQTAFRSIGSKSSSFEGLFLWYAAH